LADKLNPVSMRKIIYTLTLIFVFYNISAQTKQAITGPTTKAKSQVYALDTLRVEVKGMPGAEMWTMRGSEVRYRVRV
jgi:hypothetical protein